MTNLEYADLPMWLHYMPFDEIRKRARISRGIILLDGRTVMWADLLQNAQEREFSPDTHIAQKGPA